MFITYYFIIRLEDFGKVPLPSKMYTKPVDVASPHHFHGSKSGSSTSLTYEPLPWTAFFDRKEKMHGVVPIYIAGDKGHVFICMHGAGHSALSFAALAKAMKSRSIVISFDFRGHGDHHC